MDSTNILNICAGALTIFIIISEYIGSKSESKQPSTILQLLVTLVAAIVYRLSGHVLMTSFNRSEIKYHSEVLLQLNKIKQQKDLLKTETFRSHTDTIRRNARSIRIETPNNKRIFMEQLQMHEH